MVSKDFKLNGINYTQINKIIDIVQKNEPNSKYSLSVFNPLLDSLGVLIPETSHKVFLNCINHIDFKKLRPIYNLKYISSNFLMIKFTGETVFVKSQNELIASETSKDNFLSIGENWFSINQLSIYLLILLLLLLVVDSSLKFQVLK